MIAFELQEKVLKDVTERLESLGLSYMLSGSMAMVKYGMHRMTNDIDIVVELIGGYGIAKVACNHCTGRTAVEKMLELGLPVVRGTARHGSQTNLFVGNGDVLELG